MEGEIGKILFRRSVNQGLRYTTVISDEDSSAFKTLSDSKPYGEDFLIQKVNCLNRIQKKIYRKIDKARKDHKLGGAGEGKLTQGVGTFFANLYRINLKKYLGQNIKIRRNIQASIFHHASTDKKPMHFICPKGPTSWCKYQRTESQGAPIEKGWHTKKSNLKHKLNPECAKVLFQIFETMLKDEVLSKISGKRKI